MVHEIGDAARGDDLSALFRNQIIRPAFSQRWPVLFDHTGGKPAWFIQLIELETPREVRQYESTESHGLEVAFPHRRMKRAGTIEKMVEPVKPLFRCSDCRANVQTAQGSAETEAQ